jgi:pimeloyl-ACP methyl ester carboxylesterase
MSERFCRVGDVELCYETLGDPANPTLLLIMGLGAQMIYWPEPFCEALVGEGFHVVRFDNRDAGRSTILRHVRPPSAAALISRRLRDVAYTLEDMADDAAGLLDHLDVDAAHVVGASMGGMIAQTLAVRHPDRVLSLVSIMSTTGGRKVGRPQRRLIPLLLRPVPRDPDGYVKRMMAGARLIGSKGFPQDPERLKTMLARAYDRGVHPSGTLRQLGAIVASGDRTPALASVRAPTLVIHGDADPLVTPSGGQATAAAIPGARLLTIEGMGHDLPRQVWARLVAAITTHARAAEADSAEGGEAALTATG